MMEEALKKLLKNGVIGEKLLDANTKKLLQEVDSLRNKSDTAKDELQKVLTLKLRQEKDFIYIRQMVEILQELTTTYRKNAESEVRHNKDMSYELQGCIRHQNQQTEVLHQLQTKIDQIENQKIRQEREIEDLEKNMEVDASFLQDILDHLSVKEDDNLLLLKYIAQEASQMKAMSVALEKVSEEVAAAERDFRECQHETFARKTVRSQLVTFFLQEASRRDDLLLQWEATLDELKGKMNDETVVIEDVFRLRNRMTSLQHARKGEDGLLQQVRASVSEFSVLLVEAEKESENLSLQHLSILEAIREIVGQAAAFESCRLRLESEISLAKSKISSSKELRNEKNSFLTRLEQKCGKIEIDIQLEAEFLSSSEQSLRALETILKECEHQKVMLEKQIALIHNLRQRHLQEFSTLTNDKLLLKGELKALVLTKAKIVNEMKLLKERIAKCDQLIYSQDLEIHDLRSRIYRLCYDSNNNDVTENQRNVVILLKERLKETEQGVILLKRTISVLKTRKVCSENDKINKEKEVSQMEDDVASLQHLCCNIEKDKMQHQREKDELFVDISLTELHFQNCLQQLSELREANSNIIEHRRELEMLLKEECDSIRGTSSSTRTQIRDQEDRQYIILKKIYSMKTKLEQIKEKYYRIRTSVNVPEEEEISPFYIMLEIAKEREGLQGAGDALDHEVRKAEDDIEALGTVLSLLSVESDQFRSQLHHLMHHSENDTEKSELENNFNKLEEDLKTWGELNEQENKELQETNEHLREIELQSHAVEDLLREKNVHVRQMDGEIGIQRMKASHAEFANCTIKSKLQSKSMKLEDVELRIVQERLKVVNSLLGEVVSSSPEVVDACILYCQQENVPPPKVSSLTRRREYGSRSSIDSLPSSTSGAKSRDGSLTATKAPHHSSITSLASQDSGSSSVISNQVGAPSVRSRPRSKGHPSSGQRAFEAKNKGTSTELCTKKKKKKGKCAKIQAADDKCHESIVHLLKPEFSKEVQLRQDFKGNKVLQKPSFRI